MTNEEDTKLRLSDKERIMTLLKEYELSQKMHNYYGHLTWQIASILVGGSIAGLALVISNIPRPSWIVSFFAIAVIGTASIFWLYMRRYSKITQLHLDRCREIEKYLGMRQHTNVKEGEIPRPTGWVLSQSLCIGLIIFGIIIATYYLGYGFLLSLYIGIFVVGTIGMLLYVLAWVYNYLKEKQEKGGWKLDS